MVFSSSAFIFQFLPVVLGIYFLLPRNSRNFFLLLASLFFYGYGERRMIAVMLFTIVLDYLAALGIAGALGAGWNEPIQKLVPGGPRTPSQRGFLVASIASNLGVLAIFKYFNFGIDNYNALISSLGLKGWMWENAPSIFLPMGISFYTFQSLSYTIDVYRGEVKANRSLADFACFVTLFPQLVAGPIVRYEEIANELDTRYESPSEFAIGVKRFVLGLAKKVLIADSIAFTCDEIFAIPNDAITPGIAWLGVLTFSIQVYFDFSGYSDMAIGMGHMLGFHFRENFNHPFVATSVTDLWRRWHISLSTWFRDYYYIPMGGSRRSPLRIYFNLISTFFLVGLWHGANWTYVFFGLTHGFALIFERSFRNVRFPKFMRMPGMIYTHIVWLVGLAFFRGANIHQSWIMIQAMFGFAPGDGVVYRAQSFLSADTLALLIVGYIASTPLYNALGRISKSLSERLTARPAVAFQVFAWTVNVAYLAVIFGDSVAAMLFSKVAPFIYFRF